MDQDYAIEKSILKHAAKYCDLWERHNLVLENHQFKNILWTAVIWKMENLDGLYVTSFYFFFFLNVNKIY